MAENKNFKPTIYTPVNHIYMSNDSVKTRISFQYWSNLLRITIAEPSNQRNDNTFEYNDICKVYLPAQSAYMLAQAIDKVLSGEVKSSGINISNFYIGVSIENNVAKLTVVVFDKQTNDIIQVIDHEFNNNRYELINNLVVNGNDLKFDKERLSKAELELFKIVLVQFVNAMSYAYAYAGAVASTFDGRLNNLYKLTGGKDNSRSGMKASARFADSDTNESTYDSIDDIPF